ncbi:response regulator [bacterium]|nr:response regulator [bacterium]
MTAAESTVFVVDDDDAVRESVCFLMQSAKLKAEGHDSARSFLAAHDVERPGCLVLDIRMPGMTGVELHDELRRSHCVLPIIFVTGHGDVGTAVRAMQEGAWGFLEKPFRDDELLHTVKGALEEDARNRVALAAREEILARVSRLTPRELDVMNRIVDGDPNKAIAFDLKISERTVEIHRSRVMAKMGAGSLPHLVRMALRTRD